MIRPKFLCAGHVVEGLIGPIINLVRSKCKCLICVFFLARGIPAHQPLLGRRQSLHTCQHKVYQNDLLCPNKLVENTRKFSSGPNQSIWSICIMQQKGNQLTKTHENCFLFFRTA